MDERVKFIDMTRIPLTREGSIYATNNQFQKAGPKGFVEVKVLENDNLYVRVDLPGVPDDSIRYRVDSVRQKVVIFSGESRKDKYSDVREYSGTAGLGCDCCEITNVDAKMKDGVLRMIVSRVKVKDQYKKCTLTVPPFTGKSGRQMEDHPFMVKGRKEAFVGVPMPEGGLYFAVDVPGACTEDDVEVLANEDELRFNVKIKNVYEHDESARTYLGSVKHRSPADAPSPSLCTQTIGWDVIFGVLHVVIVPPHTTTYTSNIITSNDV